MAKEETNLDLEMERWRAKMSQAINDRGHDLEILSEECGFNREYIRKMLRGNINPTLSRILLICKTIAINPAWIFSDGDEDLASSVIEETRTLAERDAQLVNRLISSARSD